MAKAHSLQRLLSSIYSKPHLIEKSHFSAITEYLKHRSELLKVELMKGEDECSTHSEGEESLSFDSVLGIGVISIHGPLTYRSTGWEAMCGGFSYEELLEETEEMLVKGVKTIILDCDSGGGEAYGCFETADEFRSLLDKYGASAYGYIDGSACSAMYALICACDEVICNPQGEAGSIGVLVALCNDSEHLKMEGYERIFVTDGEQKVPFDDDGSFKKEFLDDLQAKVTALGAQFREHVSKYTSIPEATLKGLQARVFMAEDALNIGLVNSIKTRSEFMRYVLSKHKEQNA